MKFLKEALASVRRLDDESEGEPALSLDIDPQDELDRPEEDPNTADEPGNELSLDTDQDDSTPTDTTQDPDHQGLIRAVPDAHLVYKREVADGTFEELWIYNVTTLQDELLNVRKAILAGTDIPVGKMQSPDGSQTYTMWSAGNAELLIVQGLQN